jgi:hypothetical protein
MHRRFYLLIITLAALTGSALSASAAGANPDAATVAEALRIADRWAARDAPGHTNHCAGGNLRLTFSNAAVDREATRAGIPARQVEGVADGWVWTGAAWGWDYTRCTATVREGLSAPRTCRAIAHELMHYVIGPAHVGPLDPRHPGALECNQLLPEATLTASGKAHRHRRTKTQIARNLRYKRRAAAERSRVRREAVARAQRHVQRG